MIDWVIKIHQTKKLNIPYLIVLGEKDMKEGMITLESRNGEKETLKKRRSSFKT